MKEALEEFWQVHNLGDCGKTNLLFNEFKIGGINFKLPNISKKGYLLHDMNHLLSGFGIDWLSEFEIAAWEISSGGRKGYVLSWFYPIAGMLFGLILIPKRTINAFKKGRNRINAHVLSTKNNLLMIPFEDFYSRSFRIHKNTQL